MLIRLMSGTLALLAFTVAIIAGVWAGNDLSTVLLRAWWALVLFLIFGALIGWMTQLVMDEYLEKTARQITAPQEPASPPPTESAAGAGNPGKA